MKGSVRWWMAAAVLSSGAAQADEWIGPYSIEYIENGSGHVFFMRDWAAGLGNYTSPQYPTCNRSTVVFMNTLPDGVVNRTLAIALAAQASGLRVKFLINGCAGGTSGFLSARAIAIDNAF